MSSSSKKMVSLASTSAAGGSSLTVPSSSAPSSWDNVSTLRQESADAGSGAENSDMETQVTSDRTSKSRPQSQRSSGTKKKKLAKFQAYLAARKAANGETMEEWRIEQAIQMTDEQRKANSALTTEVVSAAAETRLNVFERLFRGCDEDYRTRKVFAASNLKAIEDRVLDAKSGMCIACNKYNTGNHTTTTAHKKSIEWHASCDALMGPTIGAREYCTGLKVSNGVLTEEALKRFWGKDVFNLGAIGTRILHERGLMVKPSKNRAGFSIPGTSINAATLAFVEFKCGQAGKYSIERMRLRWPHQLPAKLTPAKDVDLSWWPVVAVSFKDEEEKAIAVYMDHQAKEDEDNDDHIVLWDVEEPVAIAEKPLINVPSTPRCIWISCQEQLQWDQPEAWPFPLFSGDLL